LVSILVSTGLTRDQAVGLAGLIGTLGPYPKHEAAAI
jgi:hypothetical protein